MNQQFGPLLYTISIWALPAIIAITFHEAAHGFAARMLGDRLDRLVREQATKPIHARAARDLTNAMLDIIEHQIDRKLKSRELLETPA